MATHRLHLTVITQDKKLLSQDVDSVTAPTTEGEITILPEHIPLFSKLQVGELVFRRDGEEESLVISKGFIDKSPDDTVMVIVDSAVHEREISLEKAQAAVKAAQESMAQNVNKEEMIMVEASLKRALLEVRVAQKSKRATKI
jgi:F-type H+-transporting ATPase subunit epsilon